MMLFLKFLDYVPFIYKAMTFFACRESVKSEECRETDNVLYYSGLL